MGEGKGWEGGSGSRETVTDKGGGRGKEGKMKREREGREEGGECGEVWEGGWWERETCQD